MADQLREKIRAYLLRQVYLQEDHATDMADAILSLFREEGVDLEGWRPIESAPKDGTTILAYGRYDDQPVEVRWRNDKWWAVWNGYPVIESQGDTWTEYLWPDPLSLWRPLPAPPASLLNALENANG